MGRGGERGAAGEGLLGDATSFASTVLVLAVNVLVETHAGRDVEDEADRQLSTEHLTGLLGVAPWLNLQAQIALARDGARRRRPRPGGGLIDEADAILGAMPGAVGVGAQLAAPQDGDGATARPDPELGPASLTTAELRVLRLLPTHLSIAEIADRLSSRATP